MLGVQGGNFTTEGGLELENENATAEREQKKALVGEEVGALVSYLFFILILNGSDRIALGPQVTRLAAAWASWDSFLLARFAERG